MSATDVGIRQETATGIDRGDTGSTGSTGWFCLKIPPWVCEGCLSEIEYVTHEPGGRGHLIVVWPEKDDPEMLKIAADLKDEGVAPKVVEYKKPMGRHISFYALPPKR